MVLVPAGEFTMGSPPGEPGRDDDEGPQRKVTIAEPFWVGKYEVTFAEWDACVAAGGCSHKPDDAGWGRDNRPVINVSWNDAKEYVGWLSREDREDISTVERGRVGVRGAGRQHDGLLVGRGCRQGQRQLRRLRQRVG